MTTANDQPAGPLGKTQKDLTEDMEAEAKAPEDGTPVENKKKKEQEEEEKEETRTSRL